MISGCGGGESPIERFYGNSASPRLLRPTSPHEAMKYFTFCIFIVSTEDSCRLVCHMRLINFDDLNNKIMISLSDHWTAILH